MWVWMTALIVKSYHYLLRRSFRGTSLATITQRCGERGRRRLALEGLHAIRGRDYATLLCAGCIPEAPSWGECETLTDFELSPSLSVHSTVLPGRSGDRNEGGVNSGGSISPARSIAKVHRYLWHASGRVPSQYDPAVKQ